VNHRRIAAAALLAVLGMGLLAAARAETVLNQGVISTSLFRKMRTVQNLIRGGQYADALTQIGYLQGVTTNAYEAAVVRELSADLYAARGDYASAQSSLQPVVQQGILSGSEQREAQLTLGKLLVANGQYQAGVDTLRNSLQGQENPPADVLITLAQAYAQLGACRQAVPEAKRALDLTVEPPSEWYQILVSCQYQNHDYAGAAETLQSALARFPDQTQYWQQLGQAYAQSGDASKALAVYALMYRQGMIRQSQDYMNLTSLYLQNNIPYQAGVVLAALGEAVKQSKSGEAYLAQAQIYTQRHEWFSAIDTAKKAIARGGLKRPGRAWLLQGIAQVQNRQYDEGSASLREALKYDDARTQAEAWLRYLSTRSG